MTSRLLLTGAGFSYNWGGWLGKEVVEFLLGAPGLSPQVKETLWRGRARGFESVLAAIQNGAKRFPEAAADLATLNAAIQEMFSMMNTGFVGELDTPTTRDVTSFLGQFEAIFTLNQDQLLERKYDGPQGLGFGWYHPGVIPVAQPAFGQRPMEAMKSPTDASAFRLTSEQPYFKLHGSSGFQDGAGSGRPLLILGGAKAATIESVPLLRWYREQFSAHLSSVDTRLVVVGYAFGDEHINEIILTAARAGTLRLFIVDPDGFDVLDRWKGERGLHDEDPRLELAPYIWGASRRGLRETLRGDNTVELSKLSRFLRGP